MARLLGILIDDSINWKEHINLVCSKLSKCIAVMYKAKQLLDKNSLVILHCSLIVSFITYCCESLGNAYKSIINRVYLFQKKVYAM